MVCGKKCRIRSVSGGNRSFHTLIQKLHTPEFPVQGIAAKAWIREDDRLYLYKVGKKLPACKILEALDIPHVSDCEAEGWGLRQIADYILGKEDRHGANFWFFMDNQSEKNDGPISSDGS